MDVDSCGAVMDPERLFRGQTGGGASVGKVPGMDHTGGQVPALEEGRSPLKVA